MAQEKETIIIDFKVDGMDAEVTLRNLAKASKALREEQKDLALGTKEGSERNKEINDTLNLYTKTVKENVSAIDKQRLNVGNYTESINKSNLSLKGMGQQLKANNPAIDNMTGGLGSATTGMYGLVKSTLTFLATPLGLVIGAIGVALGSLTAYFKGSEEGQDKLSKVMAIGKVVMEGVMQVVEALGKAVFGLFEAFAKVGKFLVDTFVPNLGIAMDAAVKAGEDIADLEDKIESDENDFIVRRAEVNKKVAELRERAIKEEGAQKRATIQEAIDLEKELSAAETQHAKDKEELIKKQIAVGGEGTEAQKKQLAEATAARIDAEAQGAEATLKFQKQLESLNDAENKRLADKLAGYQLIADAEALNYDLEVQRYEEKLARIVQEQELEKEDIILKETITENEIEQIEKLSAADQRAFDAAIARGQLRAAWHKKNESEKLAITSFYVGQASSLFKKDSEEYKVFATARAIIDTYRAANAAFAQGGGFPVGAAFAAITIAQGLANVAAINGAGFKQGGYTGDGSVDDVAGVTHGKEFVMPASVVAQYGKDHFQSYMDGSIIANSNSQAGGGNQSAPTVYLSYKEFTEFTNSVQYKEDRVTA